MSKDNNLKYKIKYLEFNDNLSQKGGAKNAQTQKKMVRFVKTTLNGRDFKALYLNINAKKYFIVDVPNNGLCFYYSAILSKYAQHDKYLMNNHYIKKLIIKYRNDIATKLTPDDNDYNFYLTNPEEFLGHQNITSKDAYIQELNNTRNNTVGGGKNDLFADQIQILETEKILNTKLIPIDNKEVQKDTQSQSTNPETFIFCGYVDKDNQPNEGCFHYQALIPKIFIKYGIDKKILNVQDIPAQNGKPSYQKLNFNINSIPLPLQKLLDGNAISQEYVDILLHS